jgi:hypothetical protein
MAINNEDLKKLVEQLPDDAKQSAFDYLQFLANRHPRTDWKEIDKREPDEEPLSDEEKRQMKSDASYVTGEEAKREFGLQINLP